MARILHVADLHYRTHDRHSRPDPATGIPSVLLAVDRCFGVAVQTAIETGVDAVVIAGDVFDIRHPDALALNLFALRIRQLVEAGIVVVIIAGNHDGAMKPGQPSVLEIFHDPPRVYVSVRPEVIHLDELAVATLPWVSRANLQALHPELTREEAEQRQMDALVSVLGMLRHEAPAGSVLTLHWSIQGALLSSERDISLIPEQVIPLGELDGPWSYIAAGHIHRGQILDSRPGWYAGSIDRRNFGEEGETKYALEVDLERQDTIGHELPARRFLTLEWNHDIDARGYDPEVAASPEIIEGAIVRIRGTVSEETDARLDRAALQRSVMGAGAHLVTVDLEVEREDRRRDSAVTEQLAEAEALDRFLEARQVDEERRPAIRDRAKHFTEGQA